MATQSIPPFPVIPGIKFRHVPNFPGYAVSDDGQVMSCKLTSSQRFSPQWKLRKTNHTGSKREYINVTLTMQGSQYSFGVHSLVLRAFVSARPTGMEARHLDGNPHNNNLNNLQWGTPKENREDMHIHKTDSVGTRNSQAKITEEVVKTIRQRRKEGVKIITLSEDYQISYSHTKRILRKINWKHL